MFPTQVSFKKINKVFIFYTKYKSNLINIHIFFSSRDDIPPPPKSFEAIGNPPSSPWVDFSDDQEMGMCVSVDPESGYRWSTRYCNGPDKATFVCQIPGKISDGSGFLGFSFG